MKVLALLSVLALAACDGAASSGDDYAWQLGDRDPDGDRDQTGDSDDDGGDSSTGSDTDLCAAFDALRFCQKACAVAADCAYTTEAGVYDVAHWRCDDGACAWLGCTSDAECDAAMQTDGAHVCRPSACGVDTCLPACSTAADCGVEAVSGGAYGDDNYDCDDGVCVWTGCASDLECETSHAAGDLRCVDVAGLDACREGCVTSADCAAGQGAYGPDAYECVGGLCEWLGCDSDQSCRDAFSGLDFVCR